MATRSILRVTLLAAVAVATLAAAAPAQARWGVRVGWSAAIVAPPLVVAAGSRPVCRPYGYPYYGAYAVPYAAPFAPTVVVAPAPAISYVRVWSTAPYPHWALRRVAAHARHFRRW